VVCAIWHPVTKAKPHGRQSEDILSQVPATSTTAAAVPARTGRRFIHAAASQSAASEDGTAADTHPKKRLGAAEAALDIADEVAHDPIASMLAAEGPGQARAQLVEGRRGVDGGAIERVEMIQRGLEGDGQGLAKGHRSYDSL
jgi:hypothetical protein